MEVEFDDRCLDRLEVDAAYTAGWERPVVRGYRKAMQAIRAAHDEFDLYRLRGLRLERMKGQRQHQYSVQISDQSRLVVEIRGEGERKKIGVVEIDDHP